jgi:carbon-monoxide dehydrogenase large subunit
MSSSLFGASVHRVEDPGLLRGEAQYLDDVPVSDPLFVAIVRSSEAHAELTGIDVGDARAMPGVVDVVIAHDLGSINGPRRRTPWVQPAASLVERTVDLHLREEVFRVLAADRVRYSGEPVAAVVAESPYLAADAAELVRVDYRPLPVLADAASALAPDAPLLNPAWPDNVSVHFRVAKGDIDAAFAAADVVVGDEFVIGRQTGTPIEPRGVVALVEGDMLTVWSSTQSPYRVRDALAHCLDRSPERIRVRTPNVGGGFGIKGPVYPEEVLVSALALRLDRAVKWVETRSEHFLAAIHSRDQAHRIELAVSADGVILGLRDSYVVDAGACNVSGLTVPYNPAAHLQGGYRIPALDIECTCVVTNKSPLASYRGAGRPEAVFALERVLERAAQALDLDPLELRSRNLIAADEMPYDAGIPYRDGSDLVLDAGDLPRSLQLAAESAGYDDWRARQAAARADGRYLGIGIATYVEGTGIGPGEIADISIAPDGEVRVAVALPSQGQGHETSLAQVCSDALGVPMARITIVQGDTAAVPTGGATIASRTATVVGNAVNNAAALLRDDIVRRSAQLLEASPADLDVDLEHGRVAVRGAPQRTVDLATLAATDALSAQATFAPPGVTFASGAHIVVVEVDPRTGLVDVIRYVAAHDCGRLINPVIVEGQVVGGIAQGIGGALLEELVYDNGQLVTGSFMDYLPPRAPDMPEIAVVHVETPSARNPLGIKGVGEAGAIAPPAAITNAIEDALRPLGARVVRCPNAPRTVAELAAAASTPPKSATRNESPGHS